jgi:hypothetical protein
MTDTRCTQAGRTQITRPAPEAESHTRHGDRSLGISCNAKAHIAELEAAQPDQGSLFNLDLKNDEPDTIAEAIIGNVDLGRAEKIARAILKAVKAKSQKPGPDHAVDSDHHLSNQRPTARGPVTSPAAASTTAASRCGRTR